MVLVFETIGSVQDFLKAVRKIDGLDWLTEVALEDLDPDEDFFADAERNKKLRGSLYLVMSDEEALRNLLSLWNRWQKDPTRKFAKGFNAWRDLFSQLRNIRPWGVEDRLKETGILDDWRERLEAGEEKIRTEIEIWFRRWSTTRQRQAERVARRIREAGGRVLGQCALEDIAYHGILVEIPAAVARTVLEELAEADVGLIRCDEIMFFRPMGQSVGWPIDDEPAGPPEVVPPPGAEPIRAPVAALLDGLPLEGHELLAGRLEIDDPDDWSEDIPAGWRIHGTAMASLILHGDLGEGEEPLQGSRLHVRPILKPKANWYQEPPPEEAPPEILLVDLVHQAVRRMMEGDGDVPATAPTIRIVNFSIGDPFQPFEGRMVSPLARLLDWLAWKYNLLFIVSAGNHKESFELSCPRGALEGLEDEKLRAEVLQALWSTRHLRRLLAPAEAINALTIGAEHRDGSGDVVLARRMDPLGPHDAPEKLPSPLSALGPGVRRSIKPETFFPGGRQLYREKLGNTHELATLEGAYSATRYPPGQRVATPGPEGDLARTRFVCGTSNAAALATRLAVGLHEKLPDLFEHFEGAEERPGRKHLAPLLKALLVHGARWGEGEYVLNDALSLTSRSERGRILGFGFPESHRVFECTQDRVTLVGWGEIVEGRARVYRIPLPPSLSGQKVWKRIVITLAWLSPVNPRDRRYRRAQLWFSPDTESHTSGVVLGAQRKEADHRDARRGTLQHEIFEGEEAVVFAEGEELVIKVNCREDAGGLEDSIPYGFMATIEVAPGLQASIYEEIREKVQARIRDRVGIRA